MLYTVYSAYYALLCKHMLVLKSKKSAPLQYFFIYLWRWLYKVSCVHMGEWGGGGAPWRLQSGGENGGGIGFNFNIILICARVEKT